MQARALFVCHVRCGLGAFRDQGLCTLLRRATPVAPERVPTGVIRGAIRSERVAVEPEQLTFAPAGRQIRLDVKRCYGLLPGAGSILKMVSPGFMRSSLSRARSSV